MTGRREPLSITEVPGVGGFASPTSDYILFLVVILGPFLLFSLTFLIP